MDDWTVDLMLGDCLEMLKELDDNSVDAVVTDGPYGLSKEPDMAEVLRHWLAGDDYAHRGKGFMGKSWDSFVPGPSIWRECYRVLKPGGHLLSFYGTRTYDMGVLAIRLAGFEIRDQVGWCYGCLDTDTQAVTKKGVEPYHKIKTGDLVLCYDAETGAYSYQPVQEVVEYDYEDTAYRLVGGFGEQVVSRNHRVIVERDGREVFVLAEEAAREQEARVPVLESLSELREALHGDDQGAGCAQQDLQPRVHGRTDWSEELGGETTVGGSEGSNDHLPGVLDANVETRGLASAGQGSDVQQSLQRGSSRRGVGEAGAQGARGVVGGAGTGTQGTHDRAFKPGLEGRSDLSQPEGGICESADQVCSVPARVPVDGAERRVCDGAPASGGAGGRSVPDANGGGASYQPRRHGQSAGEPDAVSVERRAQEVRAWRGHKTAVVRIEPFRYVGKVWCLRVPTGAFVAVRDGVAFPTGNSGFPKSLDVSKAIDKALGVERVPTGRVKPGHEGFANRGNMSSVQSLKGTLGGEGGFARPWMDDPEKVEAYHMETRAGSPEAEKWEGWGTALKPAWEPICVARKPLEGTVAANVQKWGTGALNIDGCRIATDDNLNGGAYSGGNKRAEDATSYATGVHAGVYVQPSGRWPANLIHDGSDEVLALFPDSKGQQGDVRGTEVSRTGGEGTNCYGEYGRVPAAKRGDSGSAARFFYCSKTSKKDRNEGLPPGTNAHPTVKPTDLMRYLCRLVTPPCGIVLDPFMGSGSTGKAAMLEGFRFIGIEREESYFDIAEARIMAAKEAAKCGKRW